MKEGRIRDYLDYAEKSFESLEAAKIYAQSLLDSHLLPAHFYEKNKEGDKWNIDYKKGNTEAVLYVIQNGLDLGFSITQALRYCIPIKGTMAIKGDGAKGLIFSKDIIETWDEWDEASDGNYTYHIKVKRKDNGVEMERSFSFNDAKMAGLWITKDKLEGSEGWRFRNLPWHTYPARMCMYRALGFLVRDLFSEVMSGFITVEEAFDYPEDPSLTLEGISGSIRIPDPNFLKDRSKKITDKTVKSIKHKKKQLEEIKKDIEYKKKNQPVEETIPEKTDEQKEAEDEGKKYPMAKMKDFTEEQLIKLGPEVYDVSRTLGIYEKIDVLPGKKSQKKYRDGILAYQQDKFKEFSAQMMAGSAFEEVEKAETEKPAKVNEKTGEIILLKKEEFPTNVAEGLEKDIVIGFTPAAKSGKPEPFSIAFTKKRRLSKEEVGSVIDNLNELEQLDWKVDNISSHVYHANPGLLLKYLDNEEPTNTKELGENEINKYDIVIPDFRPGTEERDFPEVMFIFDNLDKIGINAEVYKQLESKLGWVGKYEDKEDFCNRATIVEINTLINSYE